jgi:hypothetical protein
VLFGAHNEVDLVQLNGMMTPTFVINLISEHEMALCFEQLKCADWLEEQPYSGRNCPVFLEENIQDFLLKNGSTSRIARRKS